MSSALGEFYIIVVDLTSSLQYPRHQISHYRRQYKYNKFKAKMEKEDFDPIDYFSQEQAKNKKE